MLIVSTGVGAHRNRAGTVFLFYTNMRTILPIAMSVLLLAACDPDKVEPKGTTIPFTETDEIFANPERGFHSQIYYTSADVEKTASASTIISNRESDYKLTLYLHSYYLTDYMESDIPQEFLDRLDRNMQALREGGAKAVLRFSYKSSMDRKDQPWNATAEWISKHIDQIAPYLMKNADVIFCIQCGWLGSWGEWYYVDSGFKFNPSKDEDFEPRWELVEHFMNVTPKDRQIAFRTPGYKMRYLRMRGLNENPLTEAEAFQPTIKARWAGHNDCFVASNNDVGTYFSTAERTFWQEDSKYSVMGGETCGECSFSNGANAVKQMELTHWTYINRDYHSGVISSWIKDNHMNEIKRRLGYRLAIDKIIVTPKPKVGKKLDVYFQLHNSGFAGPVNKRDVELILVNTSDPSQTYIYPQQNVEPRLWLPGKLHKFTLSCIPEKAGEYKVYLNLPDPYESLHNDPRYSIRLANENVWDEATGYNYLTTVTVE